MRNFIKKYFLYRYINLDYFWQVRNKAITTKFKLLRYVYVYVYNRLQIQYGCFIPLTTNIFQKPKFPHGLFGIFISQGAIIGKECVIFQHVTIGSNTLADSKHKGSPIIGANCYIGSGAKIIGNIKVGNNVRIGANAVVVEDIPDNSTVVLQKSRIITHNNIMDNKFYPL